VLSPLFTITFPKVFFVDSSGTLCARASGHALDVEGWSTPSMSCAPTLTAADGRLVLRHRHPLTQPYPNAYSHPLPRFCYDGTTGLLTVKFECDPAFAGGTAWRAKTFHVTAIPRRRRRTILDEASGALASAFRNPLFLLAGSQVTAPNATAAGTDDTSNLHDDEMEELERGDETEADDDPTRDRAVHVVGLTPEEHHELSDKAWARRRWEVVSLRTTATRNTGSS
jgi:WD repeat-containing protein 23